MTRSLAIVAGGAVVSFVTVAAALGLEPAVETAILLLALGSATLAAAHVAARRRARLGSLGRQFNLTIAIAAVPLLASVLAFSLLMFVSAEDATLIIVTVAFAGAVAARAAKLLARGALSDLEAVRDGLVAFGRGERELRIATTSRDEIAELGAAANSMVERLAASERVRRDLVAAVSHDLRTPLTSLRLLAEAIDDDLVDEETRRRYLATMAVHISALGVLIDDLFELSRLEAGDIEWSMERVRLDELVAETVAAMRPQAEAGSVRVVSEVPADLEPARANPEKVQRVLFNLIQNAIRHTPADSSVTVRAKPTAEGVEVEVADSGDGIARAERERVFDAFYRSGGDAARTGDGAGLGLAISRAIVEAHGGRIWLADSALGTRVRFSLPRAA